MKKEAILKKRADYLKNFIKEKVYEAEKNGIVVGLSGGLDSSLCLSLAVEALGGKNCLALYMPHRGSGSLRPEVKLLRDQLGFRLKIYDLTPITEMFSKMTSTSKDIQKGNFGARLRMAFLYREAALNNYLVLNTSNRSEIMTGYFTKWGDEAGDISPMAGYYKSEVRRLAEYMNIPDQILNATPSADFFKGQKDEDDLGMSYEKLDKILQLLDSPVSSSEIESMDKGAVQRVKNMIEKSSHKRNSPLKARRIE